MVEPAEHRKDLDAAFAVGRLLLLSEANALGHEMPQVLVGQDQDVVE
jgi:hypothetical protein